MSARPAEMIKLRKQHAALLACARAARNMLFIYEAAGGEDKDECQSTLERCITPICQHIKGCVVQHAADCRAAIELAREAGVEIEP